MQKAREEKVNKFGIHGLANMTLKVKEKI